MKNEELQKKLDVVTHKLEKAHEDQNEEKILYYVTILNNLWQEASVDMLKNAERGGWYNPE
jgi:hypothetical protein